MVKPTILKKPIEELAREYHRALDQNGIRVEKIILFGSHTKGTDKPWSDIDLCVISPDFGADAHAEMVKLLNIADQVSTAIEPHPYHPKDLEDPWDDLAHEIRTHGKTLDI